MVTFGTTLQDCYSVVQKTTLHMMGKLQQVLQLDVSFSVLA